MTEKSEFALEKVYEFTAEGEKAYADFAEQLNQLLAKDAADVTVIDALMLLGATQAISATIERVAEYDGKLSAVVVSRHGHAERMRWLSARNDLESICFKLVDFQDRVKAIATEWQGKMP